MTYVFDTSAFIAWWHEIYPRQSFPDIYQLIEEDVNTKIIQSPIEVRKELEEQLDDDLTVWAKQHSDLFIKDNPALQVRIAEISNNYPKLIKQHSRYNADPIVITLAEANGWTVVTQENQNKHNNIVGCCRNISVDCISLSEYINQNMAKLNSVRQNIIW